MEQTNGSYRAAATEDVRARECCAGMVPEALEALTPQERHGIYKTLRLRVVVPRRRTRRGDWGVRGAVRG
jgi:hypothetical protein